MKCYTIGYGGRKPQDLINLLKQYDVKLVVDARLRPDHASMGSYVKAKDPEKGIQALLTKNGIAYLHIKELGNPFFKDEDWEPKFKKYLNDGGDALISELLKITDTFCLLCAEKKVEIDGKINCHRKVIADYLTSKKDIGSFEFVHIDGI